MARILLILVCAVALASCSAGSGAEDDASGRAGRDAGPAGTGFLLPWPTGETWFFVGGPHCDHRGETCPPRVPRYALDFAPVAPLDAHTCRQEVVDSYWVTAAAAGTVRVAGSSLVEIEHEGGLRTGYYHLLTASLQVAPGDRVDQGQRLGRPSCEHLLGGSSQGLHVHFYFCRARVPEDVCLGDDAALLPIEGRRLSGWTVESGAANYDGSLLKNGEVRTAINARCDDADGEIAPCGAFRNDITAE